MINSEIFKSTYIVVAGRADYPIGFVYFMNAADNTPQIIVYLNKVYTSPLVYGVDYTLSVDGLSIVLTSPVAGDSLEIFRDVPFTQLSDYVIGRIDPDQIERDFDLAVMRAQQAKSEIIRISEMPEDHEARIEELEYDVGNLESLVPTQATELNQLADKDFVNSSIATSTATFRGTYSSLAELEAVTADDNDYGFVESVDGVGNTLYNRYKYTTATTPASWVFEYTLNNSSFTAAQWAAINSGITEDIVDSLNVTTGRNVGDIFLTTRTDNGLNGAVECDGTQYNVTDFIGAQSIGELLEDGKVPYVSMATYAADITAKGWCDKFGWDGTGNSQFKVPTLNAYIWQKLQFGIKGSIGQSTASGFGKYVVAQETSFTQQTVPSSGGYSVTVTNDQTIPGASVDTTDSVSEHRVMVQLAVSATDEALETCTSVLADVAELKYDYVVDFQRPTAENGYTWYRKYKSGWVEQGGQATTDGSNATPITLPVEMVDANYRPFIQGRTGSDGYSGATWQVMPVDTATSTQTSTRFYAQASITGYNLNFGWRVEGMAA